MKIVAATNVVLETAVREGRFRGDLYARLFGTTIAVPPLRSRREDILPLTRLFLGRAGRRDPIELDPDTAEALLAHDWPYNVRELEQAVHRLAQRDLPTNELSIALRAQLDQLPAPSEADADEDDEAEDGGAPAPTTGTPPRSIGKDEVPTKAELEAALAHFHGNIKQVAAFYLRNRRIIYVWCKDYAIALERFR